MFVTLAVPRDGHKPDETVEVDDETGKTLIRDGFARPGQAPAKTKSAAPAPQPAQPTEDSPTTGTTEKE